MGTAGDLMGAVADWLDEHAGADFITLASGPLGEALTRDELAELDGDADAQAVLASALRRCAQADTEAQEDHRG